MHITTNKFIHWRKVQSKWNDLQATHGYCTRSESPNSTDIHAILNEGKIISYISKYMSKVSTDSDLRVYCKVWSCNHCLSNIKIPLREEDSPHFWNHLQHYKQHIATETFQRDFVTMYTHDLRNTTKLTGTIERELLNCYEKFQIGDDGVRKYVSE